MIGIAARDESDLGSERILIYNEVHRAFMGTKHPRAFGDRGAKSGARYGRRPRRSTTVFSRARPLRWKTIPGRSSATAVLRKRFHVVFYAHPR